ncbi:MAG: helix-turn-helix domain-containing protein [Moorellales bacterium]
MVPELRAVSKTRRARLERRLWRSLAVPEVKLTKGGETVEMLKAARKQAGLSREAAAAELFIGTRTLGAYEAGETQAPPDVVVRMAELYHRPDLLDWYCCERCPIGQKTAHRYGQRRELATAVLGLLKEMADLEGLKTRLVAIAADGQISEAERAEFLRILREASELEREIGELKRLAAQAGLGLEALEAPEKGKKKAA